MLITQEREPPQCEQMVVGIGNNTAKHARRTREGHKKRDFIWPNAAKYVNLKLAIVTPNLLCWSVRT